MLSRTIAVALSLHLSLQALAPTAATPNIGNQISMQNHSHAFVEQVNLRNSAELFQQQMLSWIQKSEDKNLQSRIQALKVWPTIEIQGSVFTFRLKNETVRLEILDLKTKTARINGQNFVFDSSKNLSSQVEMIRRQMFTPRRNVWVQLFFPEAQAFVPALAFLSANAWGPLMVGIAMSGVFADFALRPAIENGVATACATVAQSPLALKAVGNLNRDGICKNYFKAQASNSCLNSDKTALEYTLANPDQTFTKWVASLDVHGKVTGIKELLLDQTQGNVLRTPIEYRMRNEDLAEVKLTPMITMKPSNLRVSQAEQWASYQVVASLMRSAVSMCQPGKYDELFRAARSRRPPEIYQIPMRQTSRQSLNKSVSSGS